MTTVFARRINGAIVEICAVQQPGGDYEELPADDAEVVAFLNPPAPEPVTIVYQVDLWSRMTDDEAEDVATAMNAQPLRIQNIFRAAGEYHSTHELWPLLQSVAVDLFGPDRAAELLAPSTP